MREYASRKALTEQSIWSLHFDGEHGDERRKCLTVLVLPVGYKIMRHQGIKLHLWTSSGCPFVSLIMTKVHIYINIFLSQCCIRTSHDASIAHHSRASLVYPREKEVIHDARGTAQIFLHQSEHGSWSCSHCTLALYIMLICLALGFA